jgi:hypothetical protein
MSKILAPISKLNSREPKITGGGMPARNTPTNAQMAYCGSGKNDGSVNVKATVAKVLGKIK